MEALHGFVQGGVLAALVRAGGSGVGACLIVFLAFLAGMGFGPVPELVLFLILFDIRNLIPGSIGA